MDTQMRSSLLDGIESFPVLPSLVSQVIEITSSSESSARDLLDVISRDQSLTVKLLKLANSPLFGSIRGVDSLERALVILGFQEIRNLVITAAVFNCSQNLKHCALLDLQQFWRHAFLTGIAARVIAEDAEQPSSELVVIGLIHDIGKLVLCMSLPAACEELIRLCGGLEKETISHEERLIGVTHDRLGHLLLKRWLFPRQLVHGVGYHHRPASAGEYAKWPLLIHLADCLVHLSEDKVEAQKRTPVLSELFSPEVLAVAAELGLDWQEARLARLQEELETRKEADGAALEAYFS